MTCQTPIRPSQAAGAIIPRRMSNAAQEARLTELAEIRIRRPLTDAESAEEAALETRLFYRVHRQRERENQQRLRRLDLEKRARQNRKEPAR